MKHDVRTVFWENGQVCMIDQRVLPEKFVIARCNTANEVAEAIRTMVVRGAPAIGAAAGYGMALAAQRSQAEDADGVRRDMAAASLFMVKSRPTAVNLFWAVNRVMRVADAPGIQDAHALREAVLAEAERIAEEDIATNKRMGDFGAALIPPKATIVHHCNTGSLATVSWGTALGVVRSAFAQGKQLHILVDETRPRLQGSRLTAWELKNLGIPYTIIADGASGYYMKRHGVQLCLVGADRIAANGDTANKIGTYNLAIVAAAHQVPFYVVAPFSTIDLSIASGDLIEIEERAPEEVTHLAGQRVAPEGARAGNPSFDVTPAHLITAIVTERGIVYPPFTENLRAFADQNQV